MRVPSKSAWTGRSRREYGRPATLVMADVATMSVGYRDWVKQSVVPPLLRVDTSVHAHVQ